jgi:hypothetical protein
MDLNLNLETVVNDAESAAAAQAAAAERRGGGAFGAPLMGGGRLPSLRGNVTPPGNGEEVNLPAPPAPEPPSDPPDDQ